VGKARDHCVCEPLVSERWQNARIVPIGAALLSNEHWRKLPPDDALAKRFAQRTPSLWRADQAGARLTFRFSGTDVGFYDLLGPDCGQLAVSVDGEAPRRIARFDGYCTYHRLGMVMAASSLPPGQHTLTVTLVADPLDKAKILHQHRLPDLNAHPEKYAPAHWYVGGLLLIGEPQGGPGPREAIDAASAKDR
jgi:hypothetical protein